MADITRTVSGKSQEEVMKKLVQEVARVRVFGIKAKNQEVHEDPKIPGVWVGTFQYADTGMDILHR